jgi:hypothetical protein
MQPDARAPDGSFQGALAEQTGRGRRLGGGIERFDEIAHLLSVSSSVLYASA